MHWFEVIGKVLQDSAVLQENVYNIDETGIMLFKLNTIKVLIGKDNKRGYRGARVKRTTITAIECVSAVGRSLNPMIIWPAATHRANWITYLTPGWYYAYSDSGYTDSYIDLGQLTGFPNPWYKKGSGKATSVTTRAYKILFKSSTGLSLTNDVFSNRRANA